MQPGTEQPHFIVDDDAHPGAQQAFEALVTLTEEQPDVMLAIANTTGATPAAVIEYAGRLQADDESYAARATRALSAIFGEQFDRDVQLPGTDEIMMRRRALERDQAPFEQRRVERIGLFVGRVGAQARLRGTTREAA
jgi:hypothetical protein